MRAHAPRLNIGDVNVRSGVQSVAQHGLTGLTTPLGQVARALVVQAHDQGAARSDGLGKAVEGREELCG